MFVILLIISLTFLAIGLWKLSEEVVFEKHGIKAEGKVIRNEKYQEYTLDSFDRIMMVTLYRPHIEFFTKEGLRLEGCSEEGTNPPQYKEGDKINIIYPKNSPDEFKFHKYPNNLSFAISLISVSIMFLIFSVICLFT